MRALKAIAVAAAIGATALSLPTQAEARWRGGGAVAAGVIGGIAAGALIAGASRPYYYGYGYGYGPSPYYGYAPVYYGPPAYYGPPCYWQRQRFWDGYGWRIRRVRICY